MDILCVFFCLVFAMPLYASVYMRLVFTYWENADLLALVCALCSEALLVAHTALLEISCRGSYVLETCKRSLDALHSPESLSTYTCVYLLLCASSEALTILAND